LPTAAVVNTVLDTAAMIGYPLLRDAR
jgi:hypothetical protein